MHSLRNILTNTNYPFRDLQSIHLCNFLWEMLQKYSHNP